MHLPTVLLCLCLTAFADASGGSDWCYHGCPHTPEHWTNIPHAFCGGEKQSPIDIVTSHIQTDPDLGNFTLTNFSSKSVLKSLTNNGHTVQCALEEDAVEVSGGGLNGTYSALQFHFHWGSTDSEHHPGSEHMLDKHRYPMEMHIVSLKKGLTVDEAKADPAGIAVLGFFIDDTGGASSQPWDDFTSYIKDIPTKGSSVNISHSISINDLIGDVDLTKFYRYNGSLTTPTCNEAVVWTVFQEPIKVSRELIKRFLLTTLTNVYRPTQALNGRKVSASPAIAPSPGHTWCYDDHCEFGPNQWHRLPHSYCGGDRQSPINIEDKRAMEESKLVKFALTKFDDKHTMKYIINTGHSVKCVLKDDMVEVSEGGLGYVYSTLQFHFHWGDTSNDTKGSEHTVDSKRYPMEMHIVNKRKDLTLEEAIATPTGLAVLGFFIEATHGDSRSGGGSESQEEAGSTSHSDAWTKFTSYLASIKNINSRVEVTQEISIDDLLGDVDRTAYYRYNGSLTTPSCNEAVVWTIFKKPIKVDRKLMKMFPRQAGYHNVYRPRQSLNGRKVYTTAASSAPVPITFLLLLTCFYTLYI